MSLANPEYDASIKTLVDGAVDDWGSPKANRAGLVPYPGGDDGFLNRALYGLDIKNGELVGIMGEEKARKTTFAINVFYNICNGKLPKEKPRMVYLTLESGQPPERVRDLFISMAATEKLIEDETTEAMDANGDLKSLLRISPEFLRYNNRHFLQQHAIEFAMRKVRDWPIAVYGPHSQQGNTREVSSLEKIIEYEAQAGAKLICLDHSQQVHVRNVVNTMDHLNTVVTLFSSAIVKWGIAGILITQVSLTSMRGAKEGRERLRAVGGKRLDEECNVLFMTTVPKTKPNQMRIDLVLSRRSPPFYHDEMIEPNSGLFLGPVPKEKP